MALFDAARRHQAAKRKEILTKEITTLRELMEIVQKNLEEQGPHKGPRPEEKYHGTWTEISHEKKGEKKNGETDRDSQ